jgi:hypothetical protein
LLTRTIRAIRTRFGALLQLCLATTALFPTNSVVRRLTNPNQLNELKHAQKLCVQRQPIESRHAWAAAQSNRERVRAHVIVFPPFGFIIRLLRVSATVNAHVPSTF